MNLIPILMNFSAKMFSNKIFVVFIIRDWHKCKIKINIKHWYATVRVNTGGCYFGLNAMIIRYVEQNHTRKKVVPKLKNGQKSISDAQCAFS